MLVLQTTYRCSCCGKEPEYNVQVDLPINLINLSNHAVACDCGYFKERKHSAVSFSSWKIEISHIERRITDKQEYISRLEEELNSYSEGSSEILWMKDWISKENEKLSVLQSKREILGETPISDDDFISLEIEKKLLELDN